MKTSLLLFVLCVKMFHYLLEETLLVFVPKSSGNTTKQKENLLLRCIWCARQRNKHCVESWWLRKRILCLGHNAFFVIHPSRLCRLVWSLFESGSTELPHVSKQKRTSVWMSFLFWCARRDLNPHARSEH